MNIDEHIRELRTAGAGGLEQYAVRLNNNSRDSEKLADLFCEGRAALMFLHARWQVTLRERPDLKLSFCGESLYAEVKRFVREEQDRLNEWAMLRPPADLLARLDDPTKTEGKAAWVQLAEVAISKSAVCIEGAANILVIESDSDCLELMTESAVHEYDDRTAGSGDLRLRRLSGIMLVNRGWMSCGPVPSNVEFCRTLHAAEPLTENLATALHCICLG